GQAIEGAFNRRHASRGELRTGFPGQGQKGPSDGLRGRHGPEERRAETDLGSGCRIAERASRARFARARRALGPRLRHALCHHLFLFVRDYPASTASASARPNPRELPVINQNLDIETLFVRLSGVAPHSIRYVVPVMKSLSGRAMKRLMLMMGRQTSPPPPSIGKTAPVTKPLLMRNITAAATSSGRPGRPTGSLAVLARIA